MSCSTWNLLLISAALSGCPHTTWDVELSFKACPDRMAYIPGGCYMLGYPGRRVPLTPSDGDDLRMDCLEEFCIDISEATRRDYETCVSAGACRLEPDEVKSAWPHRLAEYPVVGIGWTQASNYCAWQGKRLPQSAEWERSARGPRLTRFPWGSMYPTTDQTLRAFYEGGRLWRKVCSLPGGNSPEGICDLLDHAREFLDGWYDVEEHRTRHDEPKHSPGRESWAQPQRMIKGGSLDTVYYPWETSLVPAGKADQPMDGLTGVRCVRGL